MIGIMAAEPEEISAIQTEMKIVNREVRGDREYFVGKFHERDVVVVFGKCGKVAAAQTATTLIEHYGIDRLLFVGVGGGTGPEVNVGDIVIADSTIQHDVDITALGAEKFEMPLTRRKYYELDSQMLELVLEAGKEYLSEIFKNAELSAAMADLNIVNPKVHVGTIASGDVFVASSEKVSELISQIDNLKCLEMEGAAVALVCHEYQIPCAIVRAISDNAEKDANVSFVKFLNTIATKMLLGISDKIFEKI